MSARNVAAQDKRRLILDAAVRVFARQGFHASRVADIADEAGVGYGLVYHYFGTKDAVLATLFAAAQATGEFRSEVTAEFAALAFYGTIEQVLTGWIFGLLAEDEGGYEAAKASVVETVCAGLEEPAARSAPASA